MIIRPRWTARKSSINRRWWVPPSKALISRASVSNDCFLPLEKHQVKRLTMGLLRINDQESRPLGELAPHESESKKTDINLWPINCGEMMVGASGSSVIQLCFAIRLSQESKDSRLAGLKPDLSPFNSCSLRQNPLHLTAESTPQPTAAIKSHKFLVFSP